MRQLASRAALEDVIVVIPARGCGRHRLDPLADGVKIEEVEGSAGDLRAKCKQGLGQG